MWAGCCGMLGNLGAVEQTQGAHERTLKKQTEAENEATWQYFEDFPGCTFGPVASLSASFAAPHCHALFLRPILQQYADSQEVQHWMFIGVLFYHLDLEQRYTVPRLLFTSFLQLVMLVLALKESMRNVVSESLGHLLAVDQDRQTSATLCRYATIVSMYRSSLPHRCKMMQTFNALTQTHARATTHTCKYVDMHIIIYTRYKHGI